MSTHHHFDLSSMRSADTAQRAALAAKLRADANSAEELAAAEFLISMQEATSKITLAFTQAINAGADIQSIADNLGNGVAAIKAGAVRNLARLGGRESVEQYLASEAATLHDIFTDRFSGTIARHSPMPGGHA